MLLWHSKRKASKHVGHNIKHKQDRNPFMYSTELDLNGMYMAIEHAQVHPAKLMRVIACVRMKHDGNQAGSSLE